MVPAGAGCLLGEPVLAPFGRSSDGPPHAGLPAPAPLVRGGATRSLRRQCPLRVRQAAGRRPARGATGSQTASPAREELALYLPCSPADPPRAARWAGGDRDRGALVREGLPFLPGTGYS